MTRFSKSPVAKIFLHLTYNVGLSCLAYMMHTFTFFWGVYPLRHTCNPEWMPPFQILLQGSSHQNVPASMPMFSVTGWLGLSTVSRISTEKLWIPTFPIR